MKSFRASALSVALAAISSGLSGTALGQDRDSELQGLEEITVVAQKRESLLQKTPAAITAISEERLITDGITDLRRAQMYVPGVRFQAEGNNTQVFIRGVGSNLDFANVEASVGFILNGLYIPREGTVGAFFDLAQLEVLPGPQGTLYGRSSIGGNIVASFNRPDHDYSGSVLVEAGNNDLVHVSYAQNVPVSKTLALRAAVDYAQDDGIMRTGAASKDDTGIRLSALYTPAEDFSVYVWGQSARKDGHPQNLVNKGLDPKTFQYSENEFLTSDPWDDRRSPPFAPFGFPKTEHQKYESYIVGAEVNWDVGDLRLTYVPGYFNLKSNPYFWIGDILANLPAEYEQQSHELRASKELDRHRWMVGVYLYRVENSGNQRLFVNQPFAFLQTNILDNRIDNAATFGEYEYSWTDSLRLTLGGRFSYDERKANGLAPDQLGAAPWDFHKDYQQFDWKVGLDYDVTEDILLYGGIQTGSKPGTYNELPETPTFDNAVDPTDLLAYTVGMKSTLMDASVNLNLEAFYYDYSDLAIQAYDVSAPFNPQFTADKVEIYGMQLDLKWRLGEQSMFDLNMSYTHARNEDFVTPAGDDFSGYQTPYSPDWTALLRYQYVIPMSGGDLVARLSARYESSWYADYAHNPGVRQQSYWKEDVSLTYESNANWTIGLWANNLSDEPVMAAAAGQGIPGPASTYLEDPFMAGIRATYRY